MFVGDNVARALASGGGSDTFLGNKGNDFLIGDNLALGNGQTVGGGNDDLRGGSGNDKFNAGPGQDNCSGGSGKNADTSHPRCEQDHHIP